ncbi:glycosyltransferase [Myxococcus sp. RHSTA-1-4]|uniref:glycosyltransferase n=1 Tax=Myxococcus sp. RHSTA-1-4 TaxID=2874601 RepID=UPI001CBD3110|nr:glycosyltransferase [Myxococcus sp. RHSTA-1-4]MBZ4422339.1 glycosyltransferase [Myxococcus sp. RHSTA-1-4]
MAKIVIAPLPVPGHVNPTLKLARVLRDAGHHVVYASMPDMGTRLRAEGFAFEPLFEAAYPPGSLEALPSHSGNALALLRMMRREVRRQDAMLQAMLDGELERRLGPLKPDLFLYDEKLRHIPPVAHGMGLPTVRFSVTVPPQLLPPEAPGRVHRPPPRSVERVLSALSLAPRMSWYFDQLARKHGYPGRLDTPALRRDGRPMADLLFFPEAFVGAGRDLPGERYHVGPLVDVDRQEPDLPWERIPEGGPLVFFSLGTLAFSTPRAPRLVRAMLEAAAQRPQWRFVLAVGGTLPPGTLGTAPPNALVVGHAPQLRLLQKADVMVNHGGTNSVKECIYFGVPMVAVPLQHDQPAIARLAAHHGVGTCLPPEEFTAKSVLAHLDEVLGNPACRSAVTRMRELFREADAPGRITAVIDDILQRFQPARAASM